MKVATGENEPVPSATSVYPGADWFEREAYDMYGILFTGHPDLKAHSDGLRLRRLSLPRTSRLTGSSRCVTTTRPSASSTNPVELKQEFRNFDFLSPWEGTEYVLPGDEKADHAELSRPAAIREGRHTGLEQSV